MKLFLKKIINSIAGNYIQESREKKQIKEWEKSGSPIPPIHVVKQREIKKYANLNNIKIFVETGTYQGHMVEAMKDYFDKILSIELDNNLQKKAAEKFAAYKHIEILNGDSGEVIGNLLTQQIKDRCLFWLDGHYSGGITAKSTLQTPILQELVHIKNHVVKNHVILIDDLHCFDGTNDYPSIEGLRNFVSEHFPTYSFSTEYNIIFLLPK